MWGAREGGLHIAPTPCIFLSADPRGGGFRMPPQSLPKAWSTIAGRPGTREVLARRSGCVWGGPEGWVGSSGGW